MKTVYFDCPRKNLVLGIVIDSFEDMTVKRLGQFAECDAERYIKIILEQDGITVCQTLVKFELGNKDILTDVRILMENDFADMQKIKSSLNASR